MNYQTPNSCGNCGATLSGNGTCARCDRPRFRWALAVVAAVALTGCTPSVGTTFPPPSTGAEGDTYIEQTLASLPVKGRAPKTGYDRDNFGSGWTDVDRNGCDTRNDILARDLAGPEFKPGTHDCVVLTGTLFDPYTAEQIEFRRGQGTSDDVQIDHIVALSDAWQKGAQQLTEDEREAFANDPLNLLAVDGPTNGQKGDSDAATWLPPDRDAWCGYVARQVAVKADYRLWVTAAERDAMERVIDTCPVDLLDRPDPYWGITG